MSPLDEILSRVIYIVPDSLYAHAKQLLGTDSRGFYQLDVADLNSKLKPHEQLDASNLDDYAEKIRAERRARPMLLMGIGTVDLDGLVERLDNENAIVLDARSINQVFSLPRHAKPQTVLTMR